MNDRPGFLGWPRSGWRLVGVLSAAMTITSFPAPAARLGRRGWKALHTTGGYAIALAFLNSYGFRVLTMPEYLPAAGLILAVLGLRAAAFAHEHIRPCRVVIDACLGYRTR